MEYEKLLKLRHAMEKGSSVLDDTEALEVPELFPSWEVGKAYAVGERMRYGEQLYKVVQAHTSQADWTPDITPALYTPVAEPGEIPVWKQPTGVQDAYALGDKVHYPTKDDPVYVSTINANVWEPPLYWELME